MSSSTRAQAPLEALDPCPARQFHRLRRSRRQIPASLPQLAPRSCHAGVHPNTRPDASTEHSPWTKRWTPFVNSIVSSASISVVLRYEIVFSRRTGKELPKESRAFGLSASTAFLCFVPPIREPRCCRSGVRHLSVRGRHLYDPFRVGLHVEIPVTCAFEESSQSDCKSSPPLQLRECSRMETEE